METVFPCLLRLALRPPDSDTGFPPLTLIHNGLTSSTSSPSTYPSALPCGRVHISRRRRRNRRQQRPLNTRAWSPPGRLSARTIRFDLDLLTGHGVAARRATGCWLRKNLFLSDDFPGLCGSAPAVIRSLTGIFEDVFRGSALNDCQRINHLPSGLKSWPKCCFDATLWGGGRYLHQAYYRRRSRRRNREENNKGSVGRITYPKGSKVHVLVREVDGLGQG